MNDLAMLNSSINPPRFTQGALSTIASMIGAQETFSVEDPDNLMLSQLVSLVKTVPLRGRLIEAIPKLASRQAVIASLIELSRDEYLRSLDNELSGYFARALRDIALEHRTCVYNALDALNALVKSVETANPVSKVLLRTVLEARKTVEQETGISTNGIDQVLSEMTVDEIEDGLSLRDRQNRSRASDWVTVEKYLDESEQFMSRNLDQKERVTRAIAYCLWHEHVRIHQKAYRILGRIDSSISRAALLYKLTTEEDDQSETALISALHDQMRSKFDVSSFGSAKRSRFRAQLRRAGAERLNTLHGQRREVSVP